MGAYVGAFQGAFQFDDFSTVLENHHLDSVTTFVDHLARAIRPVLYATFLVDRSVFGESAAGYHLLNLLLHLGSGLLVYHLAVFAVRAENSTIPFWSALIFLIHPITTETVTYISGRASGLMAFFYLLAFVLHLESIERQRASLPHRSYRLAAIIAFALALGSKETAVTFPLALLLWDLFVGRLDRASLRQAVFSSHLPYWLVTAAVTMWALTHPRYAELAQFSFLIRPIWDNILSQLHAMTYALLLFVSPWMQNFDHDLPVLQSVVQWPIPLDLLVWGVVIALTIALRGVPLVAFGLAWYALQWLPTLLIPRLDLLSERNLYLPFAGLVPALVSLTGWAASRLLAQSTQPRLIRAILFAIGLIAVAGGSVSTYQRNLLYRDAVALWTDTVNKSPLKARPHNNLGHSYAVSGDWDRAIDEFRIAARLDPDYALAQKNLRNAYLQQVGRQ